MGLMDMIGMGGPEGKIRRLTKKAMEKFGPPENRQGAIEELGELKTEPAVDALLLRYTFRVDPGITDDEEKARVLALVLQSGDAALPAVKRFILTRRDQLAAAGAQRSATRRGGGKILGRGGAQGRRRIQPRAREEGAVATRPLSARVARDHR